MRHYARNIGDLAAATRGLDLLHRGAYDALLDAYYLRELPPPLDHRECYLLADARSPAERRAVDAVLARFFDRTPDGYRQRRCDRELARFAEKSEKARASAAISADVRRYSTNPSLADVNREKRRSRIAAARALGTHTTEDWELLVQVCGGVCVRCGSTGRLVRDHIVPICQGGSDGIDNIQPLCVRCNTSKGPESKDFRPDGWADALSERSANAQRTLSDGSATHDPRPITHEPPPPVPSEPTGGKSVARERAPARAKHPAKTPLPANFAISDRVRAWASDKGHGRLEERLEHFVGKARMNGYRYADWDEALMTAIRDDWAKLDGKPSGPAARLTPAGQQTAAALGRWIDDEVRNGTTGS